jgi:hypothetical protein
MKIDIKGSAKKHPGCCCGCIAAFIFAVIITLLILFLISIMKSSYGEGGYNNNGTGAGYDCSGVAQVPAEYMPWVKDAAAKYLGGDEAALISLIQVESGWNAKASSGSSSAAGLGQFISKTARGFPEFVGGNDKHGKTWPAGQVYDNPDTNSGDARFDPERSIYATAHLLSGMIGKYGNFGDAYEKGYHGGSTPDQIAEAKKARGKLDDIYNTLTKNGGCKATTAAGPNGVGCGNVPLFKQCDSKWGSIQYGNCSGKSTICSSGCGVTSAAMVLKFYNKNVDPSIIMNGKYHACGLGTSYNYFPDIAKQYGLQYKSISNINQAEDYLKQGKPVIAVMHAEGVNKGTGVCPKTFTGAGHFIVLTCINGNAISINDPDGYNITSATIDEVNKCQHGLFLITN